MSFCRKPNQSLPCSIRVKYDLWNIKNNWWEHTSSDLIVFLKKWHWPISTMRSPVSLHLCLASSWPIWLDLISLLTPRLFTSVYRLKQNFSRNILRITSYCSMYISITILKSLTPIVSFTHFYWDSFTCL